jgi:hypothetical protein
VDWIAGDISRVEINERRGGGLEMVVELSMENVAADSVMSVESLNSESSKEAQWL